MNERDESESADVVAPTADAGLDDVTSDAATGWYVDPYGLHELRWISRGTATRLVRDGDATANDDPPAEPFDGPLVAPDEVAVQHETVRAGEDADPRIGPVQIVYNSSM